MLGNSVGWQRFYSEFLNYTVKSANMKVVVGYLGHNFYKGLHMKNVDGLSSGELGS